MEVKSVILAGGFGVLFGALGYVVGGIGAPYISGVTAPAFSAMGASAGILIGLGGSINK